MGKSSSSSRTIPRADNKYVQTIQLNGKPLTQVWFRHADIANGGTLELTLSDTPNTTLGTDPSTFPPASISLDPGSYVSEPR